MEASFRDNFTKAILATPDDDTIRLVFADWLDENGRESHARFIRHQIAGQAAMPPLTLLTELEFILGVQPHAADRIGSMDYATARADGVVLTFTRGFLSEVSCDAARWLAHADKLVWSPTVECPKCEGGRWKFEECRSCGSVYQYTNKYSDCGNPACEGADSGRTDCPRCHGTGRVPNPDPPAATCMPVREVRLTTEPGINVDWGCTHTSGGPSPIMTSSRFPGITFRLPAVETAPA